MFRTAAVFAGVLVVAFLFSGASPAHAQNDYVVELTEATAAPGGQAEILLTLDASDGGDIQGWQWGVCHDDEVLTLEEDNVLFTDQMEDLGLDFTFTALALYEDPGAAGWTGGYLLDVTTYVTIPPDVYEMFSIIYDVLDDAPLGVSDIDWCETLGTPLIPIGVVSEGTTYEADWEDGSVEVTLGTQFMRGDSDDDGRLTMLDGIRTIVWLFQDGDEPTCRAAADVNLDEVINSIDVLLTLEHLFLGGPDFPAPYPDCGASATEECESQESCL